MREAVASQTHYPLRACSDADRRRQLEDFEDLVERLIERSTQLERDLKKKAEENERLKEEIERLKSG